MARKGEVMPRCACGRSVGDNVGAVKVMDKRTGKMIKVICSECAGRHRPGVPRYTSKESKRADKYNSWRNYKSLDEE